jgi:glycosyltransferase involved in cell wall biosynthesis
MLILHIMASRGLGGAETYAADVMLSLHKAGVSQCVVMASRAPRYAELKAAGIRLMPHILAIPFRPLQRLLLRTLIRREKPDIIHCWMRRAASLVPGQEIKSPPAVIAWFGGYYDPQHFKRCTHFVGVTRDIVAHMIAKGVAPTRAVFIPTFPALDEMPPVDRAALATPKDAKVLLTLSRLHPKKGLDTFLQALAHLPDCHAWVAGDGPMRRDLEVLAVKLGVEERAHFLGWRTDRAALLGAADICVLPSRYEPFGTVILEAWAVGVPLVACKSAGPAAHIDDGRNGLLAPIDNAPLLAKAIRRVLDNDDLCRRLIAEGHAAYIRDYTREAVTEKWLQFYRQLADKNSREAA